MTKKDYIKFAEMLKKTNPVLRNSYGKVNKDTALKHHALITLEIAAIFADDNRNFNKEKFINVILGK